MFFGNVADGQTAQKMFFLGLWHSAKQHRVIAKPNSFPFFKSRAFPTTCFALEQDQKSQQLHQHQRRHQPQQRRRHQRQLQQLRQSKQPQPLKTSKNNLKIRALILKTSTKKNRTSSFQRSPRFLKSNRASPRNPSRQFRGRRRDSCRSRFGPSRSRSGTGTGTSSTRYRSWTPDTRPSRSWDQPNTETRNTGPGNAHLNSEGGSLCVAVLLVLTG